ncbi:MAG: hypothetical protein LIO91_06185 [Bacteroidales bacterium]|nr:hypothetical protein [Bacteroidales bacterium]
MKRFLVLLVLVIVTCGAYAQNPDKGYRGFVDVGYGFGVDGYDFGRVFIETSHGYQFNSYFFLGAGLGLQFSSAYETSDMTIALDERDSKTDIPVFGNFRVRFLKKKFSPFVDLRVGSYVNNGGGAYVNLSAGLRIATTERQAVNIALGYGTQNLEFQTFSHFNSIYSLSYSRKSTNYTTDVVTLRVGYEF